MEVVVKANILAWIENTQKLILKMAVKLGYVASIDYARSTQSRYVTLCKEGFEVRVRISDHKSVYKTEDLSLSPDGYDNVIEDVERFLKHE